MLTHRPCTALQATSTSSRHLWSLLLSSCNRNSEHNQVRVSNVIPLTYNDNPQGVR